MARKKKKSAVKKVSLLQTIANRIEGMDSRFDKIDDHLENIDERFDGIDARFDGMDARFVGMDARFDIMDTRWVRTEKFMEFASHQFIKIDNRFTKVTDEIHGLKVMVQEIDRKFVDAMVPTQMTAEHNVKIKDHEDRIIKLERNAAAVNLAVKTTNKNN